jgi:hypothetical protein
VVAYVVSARLTPDPAAAAAVVAPRPAGEAASAMPTQSG